jgi:hypothetical protein
MSNLRAHYFEVHPGTKFPSSPLYSRSLPVEPAITEWNQSNVDPKDQTGTFSKWLKENHERDRELFMAHANGSALQREWIAKKIADYAKSLSEKQRKKYYASTHPNS